MKYVFSDKTGTLTKNIMNFKHIIISGIDYGENRDFRKSEIPNVDFNDKYFFEDLNSGGEQETKIK